MFGSSQVGIDRSGHASLTWDGMRGTRIVTRYAQTER
jgi:hypothetical protein